MNQLRDEYWDIVKGIGIVSIVIGHTCSFGAYVYTYHLVIFFFVGAFFYSERKYKKAPFDYVGKVLKGVYFRYVLYTWLLILLHNFSVRFGLYQGMGYYTVKDILCAMGNALTFQNPELFGGALWFVPVYLVVLSLLAIIVYISQAIGDFIATCVKAEEVQGKVQEICILFLTIVIGGLGVFFNTNHLELSYNIHTSFLVFPLCVLAYFINRKQLDIKKYVNVILTSICGSILIILVKCGCRIELSQEQIINGSMFYFISVVGIVFCLSLAKIILRIKKINFIFALLGRYSFSIMALHFFVIKFIDRVYAWIIGEKNPVIFGRWVTAYSEKLWIIYILLGSIVPVFLPLFVKYIKKWLQRCTKGT